MAKSEKKAKEQVAFKVNVQNDGKTTAVGTIKASNSLEAYRKLDRLNAANRRILGETAPSYSSPDINVQALRDAGLVAKEQPAAQA